MSKDVQYHILGPTRKRSLSAIFSAVAVAGIALGSHALSSQLPQYEALEKSVSHQESLSDKVLSFYNTSLKDLKDFSPSKVLDGLFSVREGSFGDVLMGKSLLQDKDQSVAQMYNTSLDSMQDRMNYVASGAKLFLASELKKGNISFGKDEVGQSRLIFKTPEVEKAYTAAVDKLVVDSASVKNLKEKTVAQNNKELEVMGLSEYREQKAQMTFVNGSNRSLANLELSAQRPAFNFSSLKMPVRVNPSDVRLQTPQVLERLSVLQKPLDAISRVSQKDPHTMSAAYNFKTAESSLGSEHKKSGLAKTQLREPVGLAKLSPISPVKLAPLKAQDSVKLAALAPVKAAPLKSKKDQILY